MPIYHNGHKVASIYHMGHKVARIYHMGNLVYDSSGGDTEPPMWDTGHYNNAVDYAVGKAPQTQLTVGGYAAVTTLGGTPANLYYPTTTMEGSILLFDRTPMSNKIFLCQPPEVTGQSQWIWESFPMPNGSSPLALQYASKPIVDNAGNVVFFSYVDQIRKFTVNTATGVVTQVGITNNAGLTAAEIQQCKWYDSPYGLTAMLVRYGQGSKVDVVRQEGNAINVVGSQSTPTTADLRYVQLLPNGRLLLKPNVANYTLLVSYNWNIFNETGSVELSTLLATNIRAGTLGNVLYDNASHKLIDTLQWRSSPTSTAQIIYSLFNSVTVNVIDPPANVTSLDGAIRCPSNHFMILDSNNQFAFADMSTFATTRSFFSYTAGENDTRDHNNRMCVLRNGRIVFFKQAMYQYTNGYNSSVPAKTACSPFFGK